MRGRILEAAEELFASKGYAAATTQEIARLAGIQKRMLFYYFPDKEELYAQVLDRFLLGIRDIHTQFHRDPGPVGLQQVIAGLIRFTASNPGPVRILIREIMDDGLQLRRIVKDSAGPLFAAGLGETRRNMDRGLFRSEDPMHTLINIGGLTIFYLIIAPLLRQVWRRDPLSADTIEERIKATTTFVLNGMLASETSASPTTGSGDAARPRR